MKKTELYQSFEGIKQDKNLKEQILKAVEEKDIVTVIKRPLFVPVLIGVLFCLNIGLIGKLVISNDNQVDMSDYKARTSINSISSEELDELAKQEILLPEDEMKRLEEAQKQDEDARLKEELEKAEGEMSELDIEMKSLDFQNAKSKFYSELEKNDYIVVNTWNDQDNYVPSTSLPFYMESATIFGDENSNYSRYVQVIRFESHDTDNNLVTVMTNHEFIIGYDEDGEIKSITESNVNNSNINMDEITAVYDLTKRADVIEKFGEYNLKNLQRIENTIDIDLIIDNTPCIYYMFPNTNGTNIVGNVIFRTDLQIYGFNDDEYCSTIYCYNYFCNNGKYISEYVGDDKISIKDILNETKNSNYWLETACIVDKDIENCTSLSEMNTSLHAMTLSILGRGIDINGDVVYSKEQTLKMIEGITPSEESTLSRFDDIEFYGRYYGDIFYIESFKTTSDFGLALPSYKCGMSADLIAPTAKLGFYKDKNAVLSDQPDNDDYQYQLTFTCEDGHEVTAYIAIYEGVVTEIYVSE